MIELNIRKSPGEFLKVMILEERGLTQKWLAEKIGCSTKKISEICNNKRGISPSFAVQLEEIFHISAEMWVTMQAKWELFNYKNKAA